MQSNTIDRWHQLIESKDPSGLSDILADNVVFHSPVVHTPQEGKAITTMYLTAAFHVLIQGEFSYLREVISGNNAVCVVDQDADIDDAVARIVFGAFYQSGQSCIGVQRIYVHDNIYGEFKEKFVSATKALKMGDPKDPETFIGPMISEKEASRLDSWVKEAVNSGATILCGGTRGGAMMEATLLENVGCNQNIRDEEAFGPVAIIDSFSDFNAVLKEINNSKFGLQAGIFTRDIYKAQKAWDTLEVGGVVIGDVPSWRVDHMPYGGVKDSGLGREGIRYAIEDMTELRLMVIRTTEKDL